MDCVDPGMLVALWQHCVCMQAVTPCRQCVGLCARCVHFASARTQVAYVCAPRVDVMQWGCVFILLVASKESQQCLGIQAGDAEVVLRMHVVAWACRPAGNSTRAGS